MSVLPSAGFPNQTVSYDNIQSEDCPMAGNPESKGAVRAAKQGEKMIEIRVRFWTNDMAGKKESIRQKHAWANGVVRVQANKTHGISPRKPRPFQSLMDLPAAIEKVLIDHGIVLHRNRRMRKYFASPQ
jgi:hypothetical protein